MNRPAGARRALADCIREKTSRGTGAGSAGTGLVDYQELFEVLLIPAESLPPVGSSEFAKRTGGHCGERCGERRDTPEEILRVIIC